MCHECNPCSQPGWLRPNGYSPFKPASKSPIDGIDLKLSAYTADQIAHAFVHIVISHTDWQNRKNALNRWYPTTVELALSLDEFKLTPLFEFFK